MLADEPVVTGRLLTFRVGSGRFAVLLEQVLGVQDPAQNVAVDQRGVMFQGHPVPAVDARRLWSGGVVQAAMMAPAVIIVKSRGGSTALLVDRVDGIVEGVEMRPLPALVAPFVRELFRGVALHADGSRLVVDPAALSGAVAAGGQRGPGEA